MKESFKITSQKVVCLSSVLLSLYSLSAAAVSDNTISFEGEVTAQTCTVLVNGQTSPVVLLPTVSTNDLATSGSTAGTTSFEFNVSGCTTLDDASTIGAKFSGNAVDTSTAGAGTLGNTGTATNVNIQLLDSTSTPINLNSTWLGDGDIALPANSTTATQTYYARYFATGAATAGTVRASVQYALNYQ